MGSTSKRDEARKLINEGINPAEVKKAKKHNIYSEATNTLEAIAKEWHATFKPKWTEDHAHKKWRRLEMYVFTALGNRPIKNITTQELLSVIRKIEKQGNIDTAHRTKNIVGEVFAFAIATGRAEINIAYNLKGALTPVISTPRAAITDPKEISGLLRAIDSYTGTFVVKCAFRMSPYVMLRPAEVSNAEWSEIDFEKKQWKIPAKKMKMRREHIIPLSEQVIKILHEVQAVTGDGKYVFPSLRTKTRPINSATILAAIKRLGYTGEEMTAHGFRGMASTLLHENGFESAHIEMQLAHTERNKSKASYNHADYIKPRTEMMQWWANYLDGLREGKQEKSDEHE